MSSLYLSISRFLVTAGAAEERAAALCSNIVHGGSCPFADKCRFSDIAGYWLAGAQTCPARAPSPPALCAHLVGN